MSLRKQAKILGISPTYLSLLLNGKRPWRGHLRERYLELVNTFVNTLRLVQGTKAIETDTVVGGSGLEPLTSAMCPSASQLHPTPADPHRHIGADGPPPCLSLAHRYHSVCLW